MVPPPDAPSEPLPHIHVPDHLARCLLIAVLFPPTGWIAVRHSWRVNQRLAAHDLEGARAARRLALRWHRLSALFLVLTLGSFVAVCLRVAFPG
jgi:Interferon-induced transmembrane protein